MKKFLLAAVLMLSSVAAFAQHEVGAFTIQPKVGLNLAKLVGSDIVDTKIRPAFVAGVECEYQVADIFSLTGGVLYSQQGVKIKNADQKAQLDYINVPILANVYVVKGLAVKAGVQPGFNVRHKKKEGGVTADMPNVNKVDLTIPVGLSYEFCNVVVDARYNWGLTKVIKEQKVRNSVFQFTVGYKFEL